MLNKVLFLQESTSCDMLLFRLQCTKSSNDVSNRSFKSCADSGFRLKVMVVNYYSMNIPNKMKVNLSILFSFEESWTLANTGTEQWPVLCSIIPTGGELLGATRCYVPPLPPGHTTTATMKLTAPPTAGTYMSQFNLVTDKGEQFGG